MRAAPCLALVLVLALASPASRARADEPVRIPTPQLVPETVIEPTRGSEPLPPPRRERRRRLELLFGGVAALTVTWAADRFLARDLSSDWKPWLPIAGPWFNLAEQSRLPDPSRLNLTLLALDGVVQAGGVVLITLGIVLFKDRMVLSLPPRPPEPRTAP